MSSISLNGPLISHDDRMHILDHMVTSARKEWTAMGVYMDMAKAAKAIYQSQVLFPKDGKKQPLKEQKILTDIFLEIQRLQADYLQDTTNSTFLVWTRSGLEKLFRRWQEFPLPGNEIKGVILWDVDILTILNDLYTKEGANQLVNAAIDVVLLNTRCRMDNRDRRSKSFRMVRNQRHFTDMRSKPDHIGQAWSGDEFILILHRCHSEEDLLIVLHRLREALSQYSIRLFNRYTRRYDEVPLSVCLGALMVDLRETTLSETIALIDEGQLHQQKDAKKEAKDATREQVEQLKKVYARDNPPEPNRKRAA